MSSSLPALQHLRVLVLQMSAERAWLLEAGQQLSARHHAHYSQLLGDRSGRGKRSAARAGLWGLDRILTDTLTTQQYLASIAAGWQTPVQQETDNNFVASQDGYGIQKNKKWKKRKKKKKVRKKVVEICNSSNTGIFSFFTLGTLMLNISLTFMFSLMVDIDISALNAGVGIRWGCSKICIWAKYVFSKMCDKRYRYNVGYRNTLCATNNF